MTDDFLRRHFYPNTKLTEADMQNKDLELDLDSLLGSYGRGAESEEIPEPGTPENEWIGTNRFINGQRQFHAFSGAERRRLRRIEERAAKNETEAGQRSYNRNQRKQAFDAGTIRQQLRILKDELQVSPAMKANLEGHILRQTRINERAADEPQRKAETGQRREARLLSRQHARVAAGRGRHRDLVAMGLR